MILFADESSTEKISADLVKIHNEDKEVYFVIITFVEIELSAGNGDESIPAVPGPYFTSHDKERVSTDLGNISQKKLRQSNNLSESSVIELPTQNNPKPSRPTRYPITSSTQLPEVRCHQRWLILPSNRLNS